MACCFPFPSLYTFVAFAQKKISRHGKEKRGGEGIIEAWTEKKVHAHTRVSQTFRQKLARRKKGAAAFPAFKREDSRSHTFPVFSPEKKVEDAPSLCWHWPWMMLGGRSHLVRKWWVSLPPVLLRKTISHIYYTKPYKTFFCCAACGIAFPAANRSAQKNTLTP